MVGLFAAHVHALLADVAGLGEVRVTLGPPVVLAVRLGTLLSITTAQSSRGFHFGLDDQSAAS